MPTPEESLSSRATAQSAEHTKTEPGKAGVTSASSKPTVEQSSKPIPSRSQNPLTTDGEGHSEDPAIADEIKRRLELQEKKDKMLADIFPHLDWDRQKPPKTYDFKPHGLFCSDTVLRSSADLAKFLDSTGHAKPAVRLLKGGKTENGKVWEIEDEKKAAELTRSMPSGTSLGLDGVTVDQKVRMVRTVQVS